MSNYMLWDFKGPYIGLDTPLDSIVNLYESYNDY